MPQVQVTETITHLSFRHLSIKGKNLKCFEDWQGFDSICPINLIVGRNNSGKSTLLDLVSLAKAGGQVAPQFSRAGQPVMIEVSYEITTEMVKNAYDSRQLESRQDNVSVALNACVGLRVELENIPVGNSRERFTSNGNEVADGRTLEMTSNVVKRVRHPMPFIEIVRLRADRDIRPEAPARTVQIEENGANATSLVERYLHENKDHALVEEQLIRDLNAIFEPDWSFRRIFPKRDDSGKWELYLEDASRTLVPLSHAGSGVKTVLLVLINLHLVPHAKGNKDLSEFVFCFEELENNLHPAAQRRLFRFLRDKAIEKKCTFFLTTHSSIVIDLFRNDDGAQLLHVEHNGTKAMVRPVTSYLKHCEILNDLDVRASDLLQSNVIVWVEGPSDRLYFNRWIELWTNETLSEHVHYQCVWYGGAPLADMTFEAELPDEDLVSALKVNRHAIVLMDSDRRLPGDALKDRVVRVSEEAQKNRAFAWVTAGREVENYIPSEALRKALTNPDLHAPGQYGDVFEHIKRSRDKKVRLARLVTPHITKDTLAKTYDISDTLDNVCRLIREWNGIIQ